MELDLESEEGQLEVIKLNVGGTRYEVLSTIVSAKRISSFSIVSCRQVSRAVLSRYPTTMLGALASTTDPTTSEVFIDRFYDHFFF
jgi:hypothetical protein